MAEDKIYRPTEIDDSPFPGGEIQDFSTSGSNSKDTYQNQTSPEKEFPTKRIAVELVGNVLNTKSRKILAEFQFTEHGAIAIGRHEIGVSGDVRITPAGITARNIAGVTTFALDAETGDATFAGTIQSGAVIAGTVVVGNNNVVIDGENNRIVIYDDGGIARIILGFQEEGF